MSPIMKLIFKEATIRKQNRHFTLFFIHLKSNYSFKSFHNPPASLSPSPGECILLLWSSTALCGHDPIPNFP